MQMINGEMRYSRGEPLTSSMDNVLASRMGGIARKAAAAPYGDSIDTGLILLRMLREGGFIVTEDHGEPQ